MSVNDEQTKKLEEEVVVNENTTAIVVQNEEAKKEKIIGTAKKVGKVAAVIGVGVLGFLLGTKAGRKSNYDNSDVIDADFVDVTDVEE